MNILTIAESLGKSVVSIPETWWHGLVRTGEDLGLGNDCQERYKNFKQLDECQFDSVKQAWGENVRLFFLLIKVGRFVFSDYRNPVLQAVEIILKHYYETLPECAKRALIKKLALKAASAGTHFGLSYLLARTVSKTISNRIAKTEATKKLISSSVKAAGLFLTIQGAIYTSAQASRRLRAKYPQIYFEMKKHDLDMLYFLIEKPMAKYLNAITSYKIHKKVYTARVEQVYCDCKRR
jgi:hypothetical protein